MSILARLFGKGFTIGAGFSWRGRQRTRGGGRAGAFPAGVVRVDKAKPRPEPKLKEGERP